MFYQEKEINDIIICPYCKLKYKDPRILPCGRSLCFGCIDLLINNKKSLICPLCNETHEQQKDFGFYKNLELARLIEKKADEVYRSEHVEVLKIKLNELLQKSEILCQNNKISLNKLKEHCNNLRFEIQTLTEEILDSVNTYNKELLKEIDNYEKDCIKKFEGDRNYHSNFTITVNEINEFYSKWIGYLSNFSISDKDVLDGINETDKCMLNLDKEILNLRDKTFNGRMLKFEKNKNKIDKSLIGKLNYENISFSFDHFLNEYKKLNLIEILNGYRYGDQIGIEAFNSKNGEHFFISFIDQLSNSLNLIILDSKGAVINKKSNKSTKENLVTLNRFILTKLHDNIFLVFTAASDNLFASSYKLQKFDEKLNLVKEMNIKFNINHIASFNKRIYSLSSLQFGYNAINVYDANFNFIEKIGQSSDTEPFYFPNTVAKLEVNETYFILLDLVQVKLLNRNDGKLEKSIMVLTSDFSVYLNRYILAYDTKDKVLSCYDFDANKVTENKFEKFNDQIRLIGSLNEALCFYDPVELSLSFNFKT